MINAERREKVRLRPKDLTFVAVRPKFAKLGRLLDISRRGLCFQYMAESMAEADQEGTTISLEIDIFIKNNEYYLPSLLCKMIYDAKMKDGMIFPFGLEYRRCGLQFRKPERKQIYQLELFLKNQTAETGGEKNGNRSQGNRWKSPIVGVF